MLPVSSGWAVCLLVGSIVRTFAIVRCVVWSGDICSNRIVGSSIFSGFRLLAHPSAILLDYALGLLMSMFDLLRTQRDRIRIKISVDLLSLFPR